MKLCELSKDHALTLYNIHLQTFDMPWTVDAFDVLLNDPACSGWLSLDQNGVTGFLLIRTIIDQSEIMSLAVLPRFRRQGIAQNLVKTYLDHLNENNIHESFLEVDVNNEAAISLYSGLGFKKIGLRPDYYDHPDGSKTSALLMKWSQADVNRQQPILNTLQ